MESPAERDVRPAPPAPAALQLIHRALRHCRQSATERMSRDRARIRHECLDRLGEAAERALRGESPAAVPSWAGVAARQVIGELRAALLDELAKLPADVSVADAVAALRAIGGVEATTDGGAARRFTEQLSGVDAMELVVSVAHDMRSPLASIQFLVDTMRQERSGPITPRQSQQLLLVHSAAFALGALTRDVIDLASGGNRLLEPTSRPFSVRECLRSVEHVIRPMAEEKELTLTLEGPAVDHRIGQPIALGRVLLNLVTNALKFADEGSVRVTARELSRTLLEFAVEDTGRGIPPEVVETLFDAFRPRPEAQHYVFSSAGLGLSICQTLVSAMGGELRVQSGTGGSRFSFQLDLPPAERSL